MTVHRNRNGASKTESARTIGENGGFYHNDRFVTMRDVIENYDSYLTPSLTAQQQIALVEFLKSL
jgi:cytochrome c peroxidase